MKIMYMDTKEKILEQTFRLMLLKGYDGVSISDIQASMGISRGLLYHYFGSKDALFAEAAKHQFMTLFRIETDRINSYGVEQMRCYMVGKYKKLIEETLNGVSIINYDFLYYRVMQQSEELAALYQRIRDDELQGWLVALINSQKRGELRNGLDIRQLANQFIYVTDGVWMEAVNPTANVNLIMSLSTSLETLCSLIKK